MHRILAVLLTLVLVGCSPARTVEAVGLLQDVARQTVPTGLERRTIAYGEEGRRADLYARPGARAGLILVPGAAAEALDDPRMIGFADALSRHGFLVMVPALAGDDPLQVSARDADAVAEAVEHLRAAAGLAEIGLAAPSYAAGPTILAATRDEVAPHIRFIVTIGAYHDIVESIAYVTTGAYREGPDAPWRQGRPDPAAKWIFLAANADTVPDPGDAARLRLIAEAAVAGLDPLPAAGLGPEGRAAFALFVNRDPERVAGLIASLPAAMRAEIEALDLARVDLDRLQADLLLVHGRGDPLVPHTESRRLAERAGGRARLYILNDLDHVDLAAPGIGDSVTLLRVAYRLLAQRDAVAAGR